MYYVLGHQIDVLEIATIFIVIMFFEAIIYVTNYTGDEEKHLLAILFLSLLQFLGITLWSIFF